ncbi:MAG TPA: hypothetical protein VH643_21330 [Gemmataceae bacterium]|jgi:hypothetical protein
MEENLVGYLLKSLDDETNQQVEASLETSPELRSRLELLERALAPLSSDAEAPEPRPGLVLSTLARIAEHQCRKLPDAPPPSRSQASSGGRYWFRRPDALVAAVLLIVFGGLSTSALLHLWRDYHARMECQNNLRVIWGGLQRYCDSHEGDFPRVEEKGPHGVAGIFAPVLFDEGSLTSEASLRCPAQKATAARPHSLREMEELYGRDPELYRREAGTLAGDYAYTLGYRDDGGHHGLRCDSGDRLPIMADRLGSLDQRNSANHGGRGQNVLFLGGNVIFCTQRTVGIDGDDIFVNWDNRVLAGKAREDTVLGASGDTPTPRE